MASALQGSSVIAVVVDMLLEEARGVVVKLAIQSVVVYRW